MSVVTDPIADMLTRIRNAGMAGEQNVSMPSSKLKVEIARILKEQGFIDDYQLTRDEPQPFLRIRVKYVGARRERRPVLSGLKRVSRPGRRVYAGKDEAPWVLSGMGIAILSTSKGLMTGDEARRQGIGGEVLCHIW
jgi:small subunit ribosomal protein S8